MESSFLAAPTITLAETGFEGTASELLEQLGHLVSEETRKQRGWPKQPHHLSGRLRRLAPALRRVGVEVDFSRDKAARRITIGAGRDFSVTSVTERHQAADVTLGDAGDAHSQASTDLSDDEIAQIGTMSLDELRELEAS